MSAEPKQVVTYRLEDQSILSQIKNSFAPDGAAEREHNAQPDSAGFGSIHYGLVTNLKPQRVLAIGSRHGYVPSILALALKANGSGAIDFVDANYSDTTHGVDVAFGGAFYASLAERVEPAELPRLIALGRELKAALDREHEIVHPLEPELRGIYGVIFWQDEGSDPLRQRNVTVFADGEVDRSPCGSGTSARLALLDGGRLPRGAELRHRSIVDSEFTGVVVGDADVAGRPAVVTEVEGSAFRTGRATFELDPNDPLREGFLLR